ncbi:MAG: hypothetical protein SV765_00210 [Pseudomonadota bacterium]|nr:hypothetical protein [Pseudomonadota bacterium]
MGNSDEIEGKLIEVAKRLSEFLHLYKKMNKESTLAYIQHQFDIRDSFMAHEATQSPLDSIQVLPKSSHSADVSNVETDDGDDDEDWDISSETEAEIKTWEEYQSHMRKQVDRFENKVLQLFSSMFMANTVEEIDIMLSVLGSICEKWEQTIKFMETVNLAQEGS